MFRLVRWLLVGLAALLVAAIIGIGALQSSEGLRQSLLELLNARLETGAGLTLEAGSSRLRVLSGAVELVDVELRGPGGDRVVAADRVRGRIALLALLRGRVEVDSLELERPRVDLEGWPASGGDSDGGEGASTLAIRKLSIAGGELSGVPVPQGAASRVAAVSLDGLDLEGSLVDGELAIDLSRGRVRVDRPDGEPLTLAASGAVRGPTSGPLELSRLSVSGQALSLSGSGRLGLAESQPLDLAFEAELDAGWLAAVAAASDPPDEASGRIFARGELDLRASVGTVGLKTARLPTELLRPWIEAGTFESIGAAGTTLTLDGTIDIGGPGSDGSDGSDSSEDSENSDSAASSDKSDVYPGSGRVTGDLRLVWARGDAELLVVKVRAEPTLADEVLRLPFELALAPRLAGERTAAATLTLTTWEDLAGARLEGGELDLELPDTGDQIRDLGTLLPTLFADLPEIPAGVLTVRGRFGGPITAPLLDVDAQWRSTSGSLARIRAAGDPIALSGRAEAELQGVSLADLGLEMEGVVAGSLRLSGSKVAWTASFGLNAEELAVGELREVTLVAAGEADPDSVRFSTLRAQWPEHLLQALAPAGGERPPLVVEATPRGARLSAERLALDGTEAAIEIEVPGALLEGVPLVGARSRPAADPGERRPRLAWSLPPSDLAGLLGFAGGRLVAASSGELLVELDRPALSEGTAELAILDLETEEQIWEMDAEAQLRLTGGRLEITAPRIAVPGSQGVLSGMVDLRTDWSRGDELASLVAGVDLQGRVQLVVETLAELIAPAVVASGAVDVELRLSGPLEALSGSLIVEGPEASWQIEESKGLELRAPAFELEVADGAWRIERLEARLEETPVAGRGSGRVENGRLEVDELTLGFAGLEWRVRASLPLGGGTLADDELRVEWEMPESDWHSALSLFGVLGPEDEMRAGYSGRLAFSPSRPAAAEGRLEITGFETLSGGRRARTEGPVVVTLGGGSLTLEPLILVAEDQRFVLSGAAELNDGWQPEQSYLDLLSDVRMNGTGTLLTSLLNPILAGGRADGFLRVDLELSGAPTELGGRLSVRGEGASLTYVRPYSTRITEPELELILQAGEVARLDGALRLNEGRVELEGGMSSEGVVELEARLSDVRYRFDYGLLALLGGELALIRSSTGAMALAGQVTVEEGVLTRDVDLDLELLAQLLAPVDLTSTEESPLDVVALDLALKTIEGVRVKNNLADLLVIWDPIKVGGTLAAPVLDGRLTIEPGGRIRAFGQTVRLDRSTIDFPGQPDQPAVLELSTTSSKDDSSISALAREDPFAVEEGATDEESQRLAAAAAGLGAYYGERIASRLTEALGGGSISLQPVLIFGEADPGARLTVSQDFSPQFSLAASIDLRNAEAQTYLLDLHGLDRLPGLNAQAFTTDADSQGAALRQRLELGGGGRKPSTAPRIAKIRLPRVEGVSKRGLKRALGVRKGDRLESSGRFAAEVEVSEYLRGRGFSDARVDATLAEREGTRKVDLILSVEPGPRAEFVFEGEKLPKPLRWLVSSLYRADYYEETALEEMTVEARRGLRSLGFLEPQVDVSVAPKDPDLPDGDRIVTVSMAGGRRIDLQTIVFEPLPEDEAALLAARFARPVQRVELATGLASADRRVEATLRYLGYADAHVVGRELAEDGSELRVEVEVGERPRIAAVRLNGVDGAEAETLLELTGLEPGQPVRPDRIARASIAIREELRRLGYADSVVESRVESRVEPGAAEGTPAADVSFDADTGNRYWVADVAFEGMRATRPRWAAEVAELETEQDFSMDEVLEARSRLWQTGLFSAVIPETYRAPAGAVRVGFELRERSRFQIAYGVRWDSDDDASALVEVIDRNALGRGWIAGLRVQAAQDDQSLRAFGGLPRLFSPRSSLELFALVRKQTEPGPMADRITDTLEGTIQLSYALRPRLTARLYGQYKDTRVREDRDFFPIDTQLLRPLVGTQLVYDRRRGEELEVRGLLVSGDLSVSDKVIGSEFSYARFFGQVNSYLRAGRLGGRPLAWAQSVRVGLAEAFGQMELVFQDRFFAGGPFSVRGYATESLGPQQQLGFTRLPLGGEALFVLNEELRWRFLDNLVGLWFVDAGNVWEVSSEFGTDLATATGLGLRALTPFGLLRLDVAHALDRRLGIDPEWKLYFGFGSTF